MAGSKQQSMRSSAVPRAMALGIAIAFGAAAPVAATHTHGVLDCGAGGTYELEASNENDHRHFEAPGPWGGLFRLEGTTMNFKAYWIDSLYFDRDKNPAQRFPKDLLVCTLTSEGMPFEEPWIVVGKLSAGS